MKHKPGQVITKIRTGRGDNGYTIFDGYNLNKDDPRIIFLGDLDEANACLGKINILHDITNIQVLSQKVLFKIGAMVHSSAARDKYITELDTYVSTVTNYIEQYLQENTLVKLKGFIIPTIWNADSMIARSVIRRAERSAVTAECLWAVPSLNCMSDLVFLICWIQDANKQWCGFEE